MAKFPSKNQCKPIASKSMLGETLPGSSHDHALYSIRYFSVKKCPGINPLPSPPLGSGPQK